MKRALRLSTFLWVLAWALVTVEAVRLAQVGWALKIDLTSNIRLRETGKAGLRAEKSGVSIARDRPAHAPNRMRIPDGSADSLERIDAYFSAGSLVTRLRAGANAHGVKTRRGESFGLGESLGAGKSPDSPVDVVHFGSAVEAVVNAMFEAQPSKLLGVRRGRMAGHAASRAIAQDTFVPDDGFWPKGLARNAPVIEVRFAGETEVLRGFLARVAELKGALLLAVRVDSESRTAGAPGSDSGVFPGQYFAVAIAMVGLPVR
ncbi:MAG TPA: hypothetical protein VGM73_00550 [Candidatus Didemnitutus sp.]|jgi:hypothetical protein